MKIEGTIKYTLTFDEETGSNLEYETSLENDIAAMAITEYVIDQWIDFMKQEKSNHEGKAKSQINARLNKTIQTKQGLKALCDYAFTLYEPFKKLEEMRASAEAAKENPLQDGNEIELIKTNTDL
jgi:hypothetical protein